MMAATIISAGTLSGGGSPPGSPVAAIAVDDPFSNVGLTSVFTDKSTGFPTSWAWYMNASLFSTAQNPTFYWSSPGSFVITMTATNSFGSSTSSPLTVTVYNYAP